LLQQRQGRAIPAGNQVFQPSPDQRKQQVRQFGLDVQRQLPGNTVVKLAHKGSRGSNLSRTVDMNTAAPLSVIDGVPLFSLTLRALNPLYGTMLSLQFRTLDRALSTFDQRHTLVVNTGFELPFGADWPVPLNGIANAILGGWEVNGIVTSTSGNPAEISQATTATTSLLAGRRRPDLAPGGDNNPVLGGPDLYFDPTQFVPADPQRFGTLGRNTLIGPGYASVDASLVKTIPLRTTRISFRGEMFNLFNQANFILPDTAIFTGAGRLSGSVGRITRTAAAARQIQLGLRVDC
jgi:hypothetical protein